MGSTNPAVEEKQLSTWLDLTKTAIQQLDPQFSVVQAFWKKGIRSDGRLFAQAVPFSVQHSASRTDTVGSAWIQAGKDALVLATVTLQVGQPAAAAPNQGDVVVTVLNAGGGQHQSSSSSINSARLQSFLQRIAEENVDLEQLVLQEGRLAYRLAVTVTILAESSMCITTDASVAAVTAALLDTRLPVQPVIQDGVVYLNNQVDADTKPLQMPILPCSLTAAGVKLSILTDDNNKDGPQEFHWIVHPNAEEESIVDSVCTVIVDAAADGQVLALDMQTPRTPLGTTDLARILQMAAGHAADLESILRPTSTLK